MEYTLLEKQKEFIEIPHDEELDVAVYQGGFGSGKTWIGSLLGIMLARKYPKSKGLVCAKEYTLLKNTTLVEYLNHLDKMGYLPGKDYKFNKLDRKLTFSNGSEILFKDIDDPEKIKSLNLHWAEIEECSQVSDSSFKQLLARIRKEPRPEWKGFRYRVFCHTNPQPNKGWIWKRFVEEKKPNFRLITAPTTNNIYLPEHYVKELKDSYDPEYYRINVLGEFGNYSSGLVVKGFDDLDNVAKLGYNRNLPLHLTCDFNVDPMCWLVAHKDDENVYFINEICIENTTTSQAIQEFIRKYPNHRGDIIINGDASGDYRNAQSEYTNYMIIKRELEAHGYKPIFHLRGFNPPILSRIQAFNARVRNVNGECHLFIDEKCKWLLHNIYNLSFKEGTSIIDVPTAKQIKNDRDMKFLEHPFDAASYLVEYYFPVMK